jgi:small multidrug resistance pump
MLKNPYLLLILAIAAEVAGTTALKLSDGMRRLGPATVVVLGYAASFWLLAQVLRTLPVGFVYAVWSAVGIAAIRAIGTIFFKEPIGPASIAGTVLVIAGVVILALAAPGAAAPNS